MKVVHVAVPHSRVSCGCHDNDCSLVTGDSRWVWSGWYACKEKGGGGVGGGGREGLYRRLSQYVYTCTCTLAR